MDDAEEVHCRQDAVRLPRRSDAAFRRERQFEIIGEALNRALSADPSLAARVTGAPRIVAFRNRLIHGYAAIADETMWGIVEGNLPALRREIEGLLAGSLVGPDSD